jgi:inosine-uridine nucleoside N-ribohydrolase
MKRAIIFDTDIGTNPDDFFALLMLLNVARSAVKLVVTGNHFPFERARFVKKILDYLNIGEIPVCAGEEAGCVDFYAEKFIAGYEPEVSAEYLTAIKKVFDDYGNVTYVCVQGCSNIAKFLKTYPEYKDQLEVVHMGMTTSGADTFISGGTNMEADPSAARCVYTSGVRLKVVGSHTTINDTLRVHPETKLYKKIAAKSTLAHAMLFEHLSEYYTRRKIWPALHDPLALTVALGEKFVSFEDVTVEFRDDGMYRLTDKGVCILVSKKETRAEDFMEFCVKNI